MNVFLKLRHSTLLPDSIRALIVGPSNCGKTNVMLSLIESPNGLKFENVYIYSKSLYQTKYEYLKKLISTIKGMRLYTFNNNDDVIQTDEIKPNSQPVPRSRKKICANEGYSLTFV